MSNPWVTRDSSSLLFYKSLWVFALSTTCITRDSSSLLFYKSLGAVCGVESMGHPGQQFIAVLLVSRGVCAVHYMRHP
jgi:hypothetical protein